MATTTTSTRHFHRHKPSLITDQEQYGNSQFESKVSEALKVVKTILDNTRNLTLASPKYTHAYNDKFTLAESSTNAALTSLLNILELMGLGSDGHEVGKEVEDSTTKTAATAPAAGAIQKLMTFVQDNKKSVTMRFVAKESCSFIKESEFDFENPHSIVEVETTTNERRKSSKTTTRKVLTKVKQYHWNVGIEYSVYIYCDNETLFNATTSQPIMTKSMSCEVITKTSKAPYSPSIEINPLDVSLTWLLNNVSKDTLQARFSINREKESCRTPRNNDDIRQAWEFFQNVGKWFNDLSYYFIEKDKHIFNHRNIVREQLRGKKYLHSINGDGVFVPVLPIFDHKNNSDSMEVSGTSASPLPAEDVNRLIENQYITMSERMKSVSSQFSSQPLISSAEATIVLLSKFARSITAYWGDGINHIEDMIFTQLYNAIGKEVSSEDLNDFVCSHNQKLFIDSYAPESFCYAVRRAGCFPDGAISIEEKVTGEGNSNKHAMTFTRQIETSNGEYPMQVPINSATYVQLTGDLFLHAWMLQRFQEKPSYQLVSRARQFSSFLLLVGKLTGPNTFAPEHGIILQNKDELLIPLLLEEMPSAKEFKDAISSLSPEQQRFAKAFRSMKLSSSIFGICVVQLKPQLEILLNLPEKSLTKEIRLTQNLLSLFIDYQIPSDLLSYDGADDLDPSLKVEIVKGHVKKVLDMVDEMKDRDLKEARQEADMKFEMEADSFLHSYAEDSDDEEECEEEECIQPLFNKKLRGGGKILAMKCFKKKGRSMPVQQQEMSVSQQSNKSNEEPISTDPHQRSDGGTLEVKQTSNFSDLTAIPKLLDSKFEMFGADERYGGALRSTIIKASENWTKKHQKNLLTKLQAATMSSDDQRVERNKALDVLDALSRSGDVPLSHSELHVIIASTHCFDESVVNTVVQGNVNPIEKIERSNLLVASQIHGVTIQELISSAEDLERITKLCPTLSDH